MYNTCTCTIILCLHVHTYMYTRTCTCVYNLFVCLFVCAYVCCSSCEEQYLSLSASNQKSQLLSPAVPCRKRHRANIPRLVESTARRLRGDSESEEPEKSDTFDPVHGWNDIMWLYTCMCIGQETVHVYT